MLHEMRFKKIVFENYILNMKTETRDMKMKMKIIFINGP